jgi:hypothetical protein
MSAHDDNEPGHGNSPAAWTAVTIGLIAFALGTLAFWLDMPWLVWASAALLVVGVIVGVILSRMGYGAGGERLVRRSHD